MNRTILEKYSGPAPRYTSYPTAPHFHPGIDSAQYAAWLQALGDGDRISLYVHIPYCDRLCWFCACHTKHTLKYEPVALYLESLKREIAIVAAHLSANVRISALHLGGGSPTMLTPEDIVALVAALRDAFTFEYNVEISVEMDPNDLDEPRYDALAAIGVTRVSLGIQDFNERVQRAINRIQTFEHTEAVIRAMRARGARSVNCDVLYGLPFQTVETLKDTIARVLALGPDRIALFGYAHVPWMKKHQTMIADDSLPTIEERAAQMEAAAKMLMQAGYEAIGIDHFARPEDSLAVAVRSGRLRRNFQGYTEDSADALIGLGASSISRLPQGYAQNMPATGEYQRLVSSGSLPIVRGFALSEEDRMRAYVIERLMCDFEFSFVDLRSLWPDLAEAVVAEARIFAAGDSDGLCTANAHDFAVTYAGRSFCRSIAAVFDSYLGNGKGRHSIAV